MSSRSPGNGHRVMTMMTMTTVVTITTIMTIMMMMMMMMRMMTRMVSSNSSRVSGSLCGFSSSSADSQLPSLLVGDRLCRLLSSPVVVPRSREEGRPADLEERGRSASSRMAAATDRKKELARRREKVRAALGCRRAAVRRDRDRTVGM